MKLHYTSRIVARRHPTTPGLESVAPSLEAIAADAGVRAVDRLVAPGIGGEAQKDLSRWVVLELPDADPFEESLEAIGAASDHNDAQREEIWATVERLHASGEFDVVEPEVDFEAAWSDKGDPEPPPLDHLASIRAKEAWELARERGEPGAGIRIAHLDTGVHYGIARELVGGGRLREDRDESFVFGEGSSAADQLLTAPRYHGTGTLGILAAGAPPGVAPGCEVIPIRTGRTVVLIRNTSLFKALLYARDENCDVITLSMGGLASRLWAHAVNLCYERGIVICAAAGNNFEGTPEEVAWPARFGRVLGVSGVSWVKGAWMPYSKAPYRMQGNDGPQIDLCAPTPGPAWAQPDRDNLLTWTVGAGTSAATPQVAAAAALWLSYWRDDLPSLGDQGRGWQRAEACRQALRRSARQIPWPGAPEAYANHFGAGLLDVAAALALPPGPVNLTPIDDVQWSEIHGALRDWLTGLPPWRRLEVEWTSAALRPQGPLDAEATREWLEGLSARIPARPAGSG